MSTASSLLLLTLVVNVQLCSPASTPAKLAHFPLVAEEPSPEGFGPAEVAETLQEGSAGEVAPSPEGTPSDKDVINTEVPGVTGELVSVGPDDAESQDSLSPEFLIVVPHKYVTDDSSFDASPEDAEVDVEGESPDQRHVEEPVQIAPIVPLEASEHGALVEHSEEAAAPGQTLLIVLDAPQEPPPETPEEEKSDVLVPVETQIEEVDQDESKMEETAPEEPPHQEPHTEEQEETINIDSSNTNEAPQHEEEAFVAVLEENTAEDSGVVSSEQSEDQAEPAAEETTMQEAGSQDPAVTVSVDSSEEDVKWGDTVLVSPPEQEETEAPEEDTQPEPRPAFVLADVKTNEEDRERPATQESAPDLTVFEGPTSADPTPEDLILIVPLEDPDDHTEENVLSDVRPQEPGGPDRLSPSATEATSQSSTTVLDPAQSVPLAPTETLTGPSAESLTSPASTDADAESVPASVTGVDATDVGFNAAGILTGDDAGAQANRGAALGAAFFTLLCFIIIGVVGAIVSKKLRRLHDTEVTII